MFVRFCRRFTFFHYPFQAVSDFLSASVTKEATVEMRAMHTRAQR